MSLSDTSVTSSENFRPSESAAVLDVGVYGRAEVALI